jgi:hypothetical protein
MLPKKLMKKREIALAYYLRDSSTAFGTRSPGVKVAWQRANRSPCANSQGPASEQIGNRFCRSTTYLDIYLDTN